ncbi:MAG: hypothetical protein RRC07_08245 [Anaerolineae bacterium]|nr:hypothetical protein [Anaerolineae bacterium]
MAFVLAAPALACQLVDEGIAIPAPSASPTAFPAATETPAELPTAAAEATLAPATFESEELGLTFQYPSAWVLDAGDDIPMIASDARLLGEDDSGISGAVVLFLVDDAAHIGEGPLDEVLEEIVVDLVAGGEVTSGPELTTIHGQEAATLTVESEEPNGARVFSYVAVIRAGERAALISAALPLADRDTYEDDVQAVIDSVVLSTPAGPALAGQISYGETVRGEVSGLRGDAWTFKGAAGDALDIEATPASEELDVTVDVRHSDGASILPGGVVDEAFGTETIANLILPEDGEYTFVLRGFAGSTGPYTLTVTARSGLVATGDEALEPGQTYQGELERDGVDSYVLPDLDGVALLLEVIPSNELDIVVEVYAADGSLTASADDGFSGGAERLTVAATGGTVQVRGFAGDSGEYTLRLSDSSAVETGIRIVVHDELGAADSAGHAFPFTAPQGATITAELVPEPELDVVVDLWNDDDETLVETIDLSFGVENVTFTAPQAGNYSLIVRGYEEQTGAYTMTLSGPVSVLFELAPGDEVSGVFGEDGFVEFALALEPGDTLLLSATPDAETDVVLDVGDLDGNLLASADDYFPGGAETLTFSAPEDGEERTLFIVTVRDYNGGAGGQFTLALAPG